MNVLITGAASGIGLETCNFFLKENHNVYAIDVAEIENKGNLISFKGDITNKECLINIKEKLIKDDIKIDVIINIAGVHLMASLVEDDFDKMKRLMDINLCGCMLVNNIFHSLLNEKGRIVIITSEVAGFDPMPFNGLYNVSKTALDSYAQALRQELNLINQKVITIRPGAIKTPLCNKSITDTIELSKRTILYEKQAYKFANIASKFMGKPLPPEKIAKLIYKVSIKKHPKIIYKKHCNIGLVLLNILPKKMQCFVIKLLLKPKKTV